MGEIISKIKVNSIVNQYSQQITNNTTPNQLLDIVKEIVYQCINSIDISEISKEAFEKNKRTLRGHGINI
jgi:hypothetical protein